jgi:DNA invertase Pin-like site-specific DNA recombinase
METPKALIRAGCYLRISSDPKDKREGIDRQREDTTALCEVKGWAPVDFYIDNDRSASNGRQRPAWDRMLADVEAGKLDAIAAWDQDRGWRMMHELEDLRRFVTSLGRPVPLATTVQGDIDLYSPTGVMMAQIKTAVSEHEIAMMKVRQRRAAVQRAERGIPKWRKAFGSPRDPSQGGGRRHSPTRPGDSTFGGRCLPGRARR